VDIFYPTVKSIWEASGSIDLTFPSALFAAIIKCFYRGKFLFFHHHVTNKLHSESDISCLVHDMFSFLVTRNLGRVVSYYSQQVRRTKICRVALQFEC
jgi:hypothetical protein